MLRDLAAKYAESKHLPDFPPALRVHAIIPQTFSIINPIVLQLIWISA